MDGLTDAARKHVVTLGDLEMILDVIRNEIVSLKCKVSAIEEKGVCYRGLYNASEDYSRGDMVTSNGSVFHAIRDTRGVTPACGESRERDHPWQIAVKRGRDARSSTR